MATPELFQFQFSHFNEKARWALDYKGIPHRRHSLMPGPHAPTIKRLSGQTMVPVLRLGDEVVAGSSDIIARLEALEPNRPLLPSDPARRRKALEIQSWFDAEVGPAIRVAFFHEIFADTGFSSSMFAYGKSGLARAAYRMAFPLMVPVLKRMMAIDAETAARGRETTRRGLDFVVDNAGPDGYLVGDGFTVADLTAASLLLITAFPPQLQVTLPDPPAPVFRSWLAHWIDHPGTRWVRDMFARHRGTSAETR